MLGGSYLNLPGLCVDSLSLCIKIIYKIKLKYMKEIPIEFLPGFWVTLPPGIEGKGSGFILAENIYSVFSIDYNIPHTGKWATIDITEDELNKDNFIQAIIRIITENWLDSHSIIIVGREKPIKKILLNFLIRMGGIKQENALKVITSKLG